MSQNDNNQPPPGGFDEEILETVRNLIAYFVLRQHLVMLALLDLNPRLSGADRAGINTRTYLKAFNKIPYDSPEGQKRRNSLWKGEWEHLTYDGACTLTHAKTREPITWHGPEQYTFRIGSFLYHLQWRLENETADPYIGRCLEWMQHHQADINIIDRAVYRLIDTGIINLRQNGKCVLASHDNKAYHNYELSAEVIHSTFNLIEHYRDRQQLAIQAMVEVRPDFIFEIADDPYYLPDVVERLKQLCQHLDTASPRGRRIQKGVWHDIWDYDIRYATCILTHKTTQEPIRWHTSDPAIVDLHNFRLHLHWRINSGHQNNDISRCVDWMKRHIQGTFSSVPQEYRAQALVASGLRLLIDTMIANNRIRLTAHRLSDHSCPLVMINPIKNTPLD